MRKSDLNQSRGATSRTARDINRRLVLNVIRKHQPISRADIARHTHLQRSTVSTITEELIAERWVTRGAFGDLPRGRKPTFMHFNGARAGIIGIDLQPSLTTLVLADLEVRILAQETIHLSPGTGQFVPNLCEQVCRLIKSHPHIACEGIGVTLPGRIDPTTDGLVFAPNLKCGMMDLKNPLAVATGLPVELENDANACALAERWSGAHLEEVRNLVAITISEGIEFGMILNGQLVRGSTGLAGEFGHFVIQENGPLCSCGRKGCLGAFASNAAAIRFFCEATSSHQVRIAPPTFDELLRLADEGDRNACDSLNCMAHYLGMSAAIIATGLAPDVIVLVGAATRAWKQIGPIITAMVKKHSVTGVNPRIVPAGPEMRLRGAVALITQRHFGAIQTC